MKNKSKNEELAKAAQLWAAMDDNEKHGVRFGLFPATRISEAEREGFDSHALVCALMDCASKDGGMRA